MQSLYFLTEIVFRTVWSTLVQRFQSWETFGSIRIVRGPIWEDRKFVEFAPQQRERGVQWSHSTRLIDGGLVGEFSMMDQPVHAAADPRCGSAGRRSSRRWRGFGLLESQGRDYSPVSIVNSNHSGNRSRIRLERSSLLNCPTRSLSSLRD